MITETALPTEHDPYRLDQTERQQDARLLHQHLLRVLEIDRLEGHHAQLAHCEHPEIKGVEVEEDLVRQARIAHAGVLFGLLLPPPVGRCVLLILPGSGKRKRERFALLAAVAG